MLRQVAEYLIKAVFLIRNPEEAEFELANKPVEFLDLASELGVSASTCGEIKRDLANAKKQNDDIGKRRPTKIRRMLELMEPNARKVYAHLYRWPSQTVHASVVGMGEVFVQENGRSHFDFDGQNIDPNEILAQLNIASLIFIRSYSDHFDFAPIEELSQYDARLLGIDKRLGLNLPTRDSSTGQ